MSRLVSCNNSNVSGHLHAGAEGGQGVGSGDLLCQCSAHTGPVVDSLGAEQEEAAHGHGGQQGAAGGQHGLLGLGNTAQGVWCSDSSAITCRSSPDERPGGLPRPAGQGAVPLVTVPAPSLLLLLVVAPAGGGLGGAALQGGVGHLARSPVLTLPPGHTSPSPSPCCSAPAAGPPRASDKVLGIRNTPSQPSCWKMFFEACSKNI